MKRLVDCTNATLAEIERLQMHSELLCDLGVALTFFDAIRRDVDDLHKILRLRARQDIEEEALLAVAEAELDEIVFPGLDVKRSKWQQLLHGDAPGAQLHERFKTQYGKSQVLSQPAFSSVDGFVREEKQVLVKLSKVSPCQIAREPYHNANRNRCIDESSRSCETRMFRLQPAPLDDRS